MLKVLVAVTFGLAAAPALALDCSPLKPTPPQNTDTSFTGKLDASVGGVFAKIAKVGTSIEGTYKDVAKDVLPEFPAADRLYMWERVLYLQCQLIGESTTLTDREKLQMVGELYVKTGSPPPDARGSSNSIDNRGDKNTIVQGTGNNTVTNPK
jgi:hypothetical protein